MSFHFSLGNYPGKRLQDKTSSFHQKMGFFSQQMLSKGKLITLVILPRTYSELTGVYEKTSHEL